MRGIPKPVLAAGRKQEDSIYRLGYGWVQVYGGKRQLAKDLRVVSPGYQDVRLECISPDLY